MEGSKKHNGIISFWKFMFSIMIVIYHVAIYPDAGKKVFLCSGLIAVEYFFIVSGYFMAKKAMSITDNTANLGKETAQYVWKKFKTYFPHIVIAFIIALAVNTWVEGYLINEIINSIWNLLSVQMSGIRSTNVNGQTWYISAMFICMLVYYPLIRKYKKNFTYLIAPLIVIFVGGWLAHKYANMLEPLAWTGLAYKGLLRAFVALALGTISYEIVEKLKTVDFTKIGRFILTLVEIVGFVSVFYIADLYDAHTRYQAIMTLILFIAITIAFTEKTLFLKIANNKFFYYLEKLSLTIYLNHVWVRTLIQKMFEELSYFQKVQLNVAITLIVSVIILFITERIIKLLKKVKPIKRLMIINGGKYDENSI